MPNAAHPLGPERGAGQAAGHVCKSGALSPLGWPSSSTGKQVPQTPSEHPQPPFFADQEVGGGFGFPFSRTFFFSLIYRAELQLHRLCPFTALEGLRRNL